MKRSSDHFDSIRIEVSCLIYHLGNYSLPLAPIFFPSKDEFDDAWTFLNSVRDKIGNLY